MNTRKRDKAFSLFEILIALFIFSLIGFATQGVVSSAIKYQESIVTRTDQLEDIAEVALRMKSDFLHVIDRPVELYDYTRQAAFLGASRSVLFTRSAWSNPLEVKRSNYQRVAYVATQNGLHREHSEWLDVSDEEDKATKVFKDIVDVSFEYLDAEMSWVSAWDSDSVGSLPRAIKVTFSTQGFHNVERIFDIPSFEYVESEEDAE